MDVPLAAQRRWMSPAECWYELFCSLKRDLRHFSEESFVVPIEGVVEGGRTDRYGGSPMISVREWEDEKWVCFHLKKQVKKWETHTRAKQTARARSLLAERLRSKYPGRRTAVARGPVSE